MNELCIVAAVVSTCSATLSVLFYVNMTKLFRRHASELHLDTERLIDSWAQVLKQGGIQVRRESEVVN